jgi:hypothetical protein
MSKDPWRPTLYSQEVVEKSRYYLDNFDKEFEDVIPQIASLALHIGVARKTLYEWAQEEGKEDFCNIFEAVKGKQEKTLVNGSLLGDMNPAISKMLLTKHGYSDKVDSTVDHTTNGKDLGTTVTFVNSTK